MNRRLNIAVYGATSLSAETLLELLDKRQFPVETLFLLTENPEPDASVVFQGEDLDVLDAETFRFNDVELLIIPIGCLGSSKVVEQAIASGCVVIDGAGESQSISVLAQVNPEQVNEGFEKRCFSIPSSPAAFVLPILKVIDEAVGIDSVSITACQSVSGSGHEGIAELRKQTIELLSGKPVKKSLYSQRIAYNLLPEVGAIEANGFSQQEMGIITETRSILCNEDIRVSPSCVRAPVFFGDSLSVHLELDKPITDEVARELLSGMVDINVLQAGGIPTVETLSGEDGLSDEVVLGRIRQNPVFPEQLSFWLVADSLKRSAVHTIELAEILLKDFLK